MKKRRAAALIGLFLMAFALRFYGIEKVGLSEDEAGKLLAIDSYMKGDFTPNAEHPMLMKTLSLLSVNMARWLKPKDGEEWGLRLPNILFGALTGVVIFLLAQELFGGLVGLWAFYLWAVGITAITFNRVGKEDTLLVFFFLLANYLLIKGKNMTPGRSQDLLYYKGAASLGLMYASKYVVPYGWLTLFYYDILNRRKNSPWIIPASTWYKMIAVFVLFFLVANPMVLHPKVLGYIKQYFLHKDVFTHHGYPFMGEVYKNKAIYTLWGVPFYYYFLYLGVKVPVSILLLLGIGMVVLFKRYRHEGSIFLLLWFFVWLIFISLPGGKFARYILSLMPAVYLIAGVGVEWTYQKLRGWRSSLSPSVNIRSIPIMLLFGGLVVLLLHPGLVSVVSLPYYSLYLNQLGGGKIGYYFPHDEFYDVGLREAFAYLGERAPQRSVVIADTPKAFQLFSKRYGRSDLVFQPFSVNKLTLDEDGIYFFLLQPGRRYLENYKTYYLISQRFSPIHVVRVRGLEAVSIYRIEGREALQQLASLVTIQGKEEGGEKQ